MLILIPLPLPLHLPLLLLHISLSFSLLCAVIDVISSLPSLPPSSQTEKYSLLSPPSSLPFQQDTGDTRAWFVLSVPAGCSPASLFVEIKVRHLANPSQNLGKTISFHIHILTRTSPFFSSSLLSLSHLSPSLFSPLLSPPLPSSPPPLPSSLSISVTIQSIRSYAARRR